MIYSKGYLESLLKVKLKIPGIKVAFSNDDKCSKCCAPKLYTSGVDICYKLWNGLGNIPHCRNNNIYFVIIKIKIKKLEIL